MTTSGEWIVRVHEISDPSALADQWLDLQSRANCSFFQSWGWVGAWLKTIRSEVLPLLLEAKLGDRIVGLAVLGRHTVQRHGILNSKALLVSETGIPADDSLLVEHSGLLMEAGLEQDVLKRCLLHLHNRYAGWDELFVSGVERGHIELYLDAAKQAGLSTVVRADHPYFFVNLARLRSYGAAYLTTLSANTRYQINRSIRDYCKRGELLFEAADSCQTALEYFEGMRALHQSYWQSKGQLGAFATGHANVFHKALIEERFPHGEVQIARVSCGHLEVGYLYNFVLDGVVSNYQSGFRYEADPRIKPGLVSHTLAIEYNLRRQAKVYDFLMGDQRFKRSLSTDEERMVWLVVQRKRLKFVVESALRHLYSRLTGNGTEL